MAELVVPVSDELERQMKSSRIVNWERTARRAVAERAALDSGILLLQL